MSGTTRRVFGVAGVVLIALLVWWSNPVTSSYHTIEDDLAAFDTLGERVQNDFQTYPLVALTDEYTLTDTFTDGISIISGGLKEAATTAEAVDPATTFSLQFPPSLKEPLAITLPGGRVFTVTHNSEGVFTGELLTATSPGTIPGEVTDEDQRELVKAALVPQYMKYQSPDERLTTYYAYQKDQAAGYRNLKHWTIFKEGTGHETQSYTFRNAHLKTNDRGEVEVRYVAPLDESKKAAVGDDLWARAQAVLQEDLEASIDKRAPDLIIPPPYTVDATGATEVHEWVVTPEAEYNPADTTGAYRLTVSFPVPLLGYPIALDPTLQFTAPGDTTAGDYITGEAASDAFGSAFTVGDFNADGKNDLVVGAPDANLFAGNVYVFYGGNTTPDAAGNADVVLSGESAERLGTSLVSGDFNADGVTDLAIGAFTYGTSFGRVYIFYGGTIISEASSGADVILSAQATAYYFGYALTTGDFNADGKDDLAVGAYRYTTYTGRTYIFYGGAMVTENTTGADITLTGGATSNYFGYTLTTGDFNADGKDDLAVGAYQYNTTQGRAYVFYGGSMISETTSGADVTLTGENTSDRFALFLTTGDFNTDGKDDLVVGAPGYSTNTGRAYIFYGGSMVSENATTSDITVTGQSTTNRFGWTLATGDFNTDGKADLVVGAYGYNSDQGRAYLFYGGSLSSKAASAADVIITGENTSDRFALFLTTGDFNTDGKVDLIAGATGYNSSQGRTYIFYSQSGQVNLDQHITGEGTSDYFGSAFTVGDFNADGKDDLAVGAYTDSTNTGKVYIFYNDGSYPTGAASADVILTGGAVNNRFGIFLTTGDFNTDGKDDLVVGAPGYSTNTGRAYIFYGGSMVSEGVAGADITLTGETTSNFLGISLSTGDFNADGKDDLAVGADGYNSLQGRTYLFYGGSMVSENATTSDVTLTGEAVADEFGTSLTTGDFNADGEDDLAVGAYAYNSSQGRTYLFYGGSMVSENATSSDVVLTGEATNNRFGWSLESGDFNADGTDDLAVGAYGYNTSQGRAYLFYGGSMSSESATGADVTFTGEAISNAFGFSLTSGDFNNDSTDDLAVGAYVITTNTGRTYLFYNDGSYPTSAANADIIITGNSTNDDFGYALTTFDYNADGRDDLVVGAPGYTAGGDTGRLYFYETRENYAWEIQRQSLVDGLRVDPLMGYEMKITGETFSNRFGTAIAVGDLNADGKDDLIVGAPSYNSSDGRVYIFYNDGSYAVKAGQADVVLTSEIASAEEFGTSLQVGDYNADGKDDLAVGALYHNVDQGRTYLFYGGSMTSKSATGADVTLTGEAAGDVFGSTLITGDFNADGKDDLAVGASGYSTNTGRAYIFYGGSMTSESATGADVTLTGGAVDDLFGYALTTGDFNADGTDDLAISALYYNSNQGRTYLFYGGSMISESATGADVTLTGEATGDFFGSVLTAGDWNVDGKVDLAVSAPARSVSHGSTYLFYGGSMISESATGADVTLTGNSFDIHFGNFLTTGDFNADGKDDLVVGIEYYDTDPARVYLFYGGSIVSDDSTAADILLSGETSSDQFSYSLATGDLNADGKDDLVVGAPGYNSTQGRLYFYTTNDFQLTGGASADRLGSSFAVGDYNADGKKDLVVGAYGYSSDTGRAYIFYGGAYKSETVSGADIVLTGGATGNGFGISLTTGDFNADGKDDIAVGASGYSTNTGRAYIFYGGAMVSENASGADITLTGGATSNGFGYALTTGDFNADGKDDIAVGAYNYSTNTGRAYIFYGSSMISEDTTGADITLTGESTWSLFGSSLTTGDFNADGKDDLVVGAYYYNSAQGRVYIFYGSSMISEDATGADVILTGESTSNSFGWALTSGDFNADGKADIAVGDPLYSSDVGEVYIFYGGALVSSGVDNADVVLTGEAGANLLGFALTTGDFNADGKDDLAVGAYYYGSTKGRVYVFYGGHIRTTGVEHADVKITGEKTSSNFGYALCSGDLFGDGVDDLVIGASEYDGASSNMGRAYILSSEAATVNYSKFRQTGIMKIKGSVEFR